MIVFPNAKINLGLQIVSKRDDGYHLLDSLFVPIALCDILEVVEQSHGGEDHLQVLGTIDTGADADNLVLKAVRALRAECDFPRVSLCLKKQIPSGAGMGGGSADASFTLKAVRALFSLPLTDDDLERIALSIGADCPFFIRNQAQMVGGIGEVFSPAPPLDFSPYHLLVVKPRVHIATAEAFRGLQRIGGHSLRVEEIVKQPMSRWRDLLHNDFEDSLFPRYPELAILKSKLYDLGAIYASMTGSGAALYGFFDRRLMPEELATFSSDTFVWQGAMPQARYASLTGWRASRLGGGVGAQSAPTESSLERFRAVVSFPYH